MGQFHQRHLGQDGDRAGAMAGQIRGGDTDTGWDRVCLYQPVRWHLEVGGVYMPDHGPMMISTRRFSGFATPSGVGTAGAFSPSATVNWTSGGMPLLVR